MSRSARPGWMHRCRRAASVMLFVLLTACGGGGGELPRLPSPDEVYDVLSLLLILLTGSGTWAVSGFGDDGALYQISFEFARDAGGSLPFPIGGLPSDTTVQRVAIRRNGVLILDIGERTYFEPGTYAIRGTSRGTASQASTCSAVTSAATLPTQAGSGSSGELNRSADYVGCSASSARTGSSARRWSIENELATVFFCNTRTARDAAGAVTATEQVCLQLGSDGKLKSGGKARITWPLPGGFSVTARN